VKNLFRCTTCYKFSINKLLQGNRRVLATDEWLRVQGCEDVYALGDCATIAQRKVMVCSFYPFFKTSCYMVWDVCLAESLFIAFSVSSK